MSINLSNVTPATSLAISISGTARLQQRLATGQNPADMIATTHDIHDRSVTNETPSQALARVSEVTRDTIEAALRKIDPNASLDDYKDGKTWTSGSGLVLHLVA